MLKAMGAILILTACTAMGLSARQQLRQRMKAIDAMRLALELLRREIVTRRTPLPEAFAALSQAEQPVIGRFFTDLRQNMARQQINLHIAWGRTIRENAAALHWETPEAEAFEQAGYYLGRFEADEQAEGLLGVCSRLEQLRRTAAEDLNNRGNLLRSCGIAAGVLVILILL